MKKHPSTNEKTSHDELKAYLAAHPGAEALVMDGMGTLVAEFHAMKAHRAGTGAAPLFQMPDSIPERKVIIDQALSILRGLRARDAESAATLANEVLGY